MGLISLLNRHEELAVPSWPTESINTGMASALAVVTPRMFPIKQLLLTFAPGRFEPIQIALSAVVILSPASLPMAMLRLPVVLLNRDSSPTAELKLPLVLR